MSKSKRTVWTDDMVSFIKENYSSMNNNTLAEYLNVSLSALQGKLYAMDYRRSQDRSLEKTSSMLYYAKLDYAKNLGYPDVASAIKELGVSEFNNQFKLNKKR